MRLFLGCLLALNFCEGWEGGAYPPQPITYAGITIECLDGCAACDDPDMQRIWSILERDTKKAFSGLMSVVDETGKHQFLKSPVICEDGEYERWDWELANGVCRSDDDLTREKIYVDTYPAFLRIARALREDARFYYHTVPRKARIFDENLAAKLKEGLAQGYGVYKIHPDGSIELGYQFEHSVLGLLDEGWESIDFELQYLGLYGWGLERKILECDQEYEQVKGLIEKTISKVDRLFRDIFVYCLKHHQPEGVAFSAAIEALLAGNLAEGIEHLRKFIEIGESAQFPSEIMGKMNLLKGQLELESCLYAEAILSLTEAIAKDPLLKETYLERATAYFELGEYHHSMEDYLSYAANTPSTDPFSFKEFSLGFAKNLIPGCYESGRGFYLLCSDLVLHPVQTARLMWESLNLLSNLVAIKEWNLLAEALAPELHQMLVEWDTLSSEKRGELAGYAFGKYGADLLIPTALAKAAAKGLKCGKEVSAAYKNLRAADQALVLESLASLESAAKIEEVVAVAKETAFLGEELGITASEIGQFKQTGALKTKLASHAECLSPAMQESLALHRKAQAALKPYIKKPLPENKARELIQETGIPTFPRPKGIPEDYIVRISDKGAGMLYVDPLNPRTSVRVMPGKPHSPNPRQQRPYVVQEVNAKALDAKGNLVDPRDPEAHIPLLEFIYRE